MNSEQLFKIKEEMLKDLSESVAEKNFSSESEKEAYFNACMESIMKFYLELQDTLHQEAA